MIIHIIFGRVRKVKSKFALSPRSAHDPPEKILWNVNQIKPVPTTLVSLPTEETEPWESIMCRTEELSSENLTFDLKQK